MKTICGANCDDCKIYNKKCKGCNETNACPFGKKCWIAKYIEIGGEKSFDSLEKELLEEINSLKVPGMPKIEKLYPLHGEFINLEYTLPNMKRVKFLEDDETYLGNQVESNFNDEDIKRYIGIVANMSFILICECDLDFNNSELLIYKRR